MARKAEIDYYLAGIVGLDPHATDQLAILNNRLIKAVERSCAARGNVERLEGHIIKRRARHSRI